LEREPKLNLGKTGAAAEKADGNAWSKPVYLGTLKVERRFPATPGSLEKLVAPAERG